MWVLGRETEGRMEVRRGWRRVVLRVWVLRQRERVWCWVEMAMGAQMVSRWAGREREKL
jgi:hypothetical protein